MSSIENQQMEDTKLLANTGNNTWMGAWSDGLLRVEWPGRGGLPPPYNLIPQDSPLLKLPAEGLTAHAIETLGMSKQGAQLFTAIVPEKQQGSEMVVEEARLISPVKARYHLSQHGLRPDTLDVEALENPMDATTAALLAGAGGTDDTAHLGGRETSPSRTPSSRSASVTPTSSSLHRKGDATIPINQHTLSVIRDLAPKVVFRNARPRSTGDEITMVSMTVYHKEHGVDPGLNMYKCLRETYSLLLHADPTTVIPALYEDAYGPLSDSPITSLEDFPPDTMGLGNHVEHGGPRCC